MKNLLTLLLLLLTLAGTHAWADGKFIQNGLRHVDRHDSRGPNRGGSSLDQAVEQVRRETGGRILSAETVRQNGKQVHRIKVLTRDRRVKVIRVPAESSR
jgi:uncharacterized membrane protein YkoI